MGTSAISAGKTGYIGPRVQLQAPMVVIVATAAAVSSAAARRKRRRVAATPSSGRRAHSSPTKLLVVERAKTTSATTDSRQSRQRLRGWVRCRGGRWYSLARTSPAFRQALLVCRRHLPGKL